ncbi:hypothetical protein LZ31DRAFT_592563 [Colletotrichum somersetense]|nr:hypothetical protein LZ31DRAFT_592563 [Colletotrichum somersetense]
MSATSAKEILDIARCHVLQDKKPFKNGKAVASITTFDNLRKGIIRTARTITRNTGTVAFLLYGDVTLDRSGSYCLDIDDICAVAFTVEDEEERCMGLMYLSFFLAYLQDLNQMPGMPKTFRNIPADVNALRRDVIYYPIGADKSPDAAVYALGLPTGGEGLSRSFAALQAAHHVDGPVITTIPALLKTS